MRPPTQKETMRDERRRNDKRTNDVVRLDRRWKKYDRRKKRRDMHSQDARHECLSHQETTNTAVEYIPNAEEQAFLKQAEDMAEEQTAEGDVFFDQAEDMAEEQTAEGDVFFDQAEDMAEEQTLVPWKWKWNWLHRLELDAFNAWRHHVAVMHRAAAGRKRPKSAAKKPTAKKENKIENLS